MGREFGGGVGWWRDRALVRSRCGDGRAVEVADGERLRGAVGAGERGLTRRRVGEKDDG